MIFNQGEFKHKHSFVNFTWTIGTRLAAFKYILELTLAEHFCLVALGLTIDLSVTSLNVGGRRLEIFTLEKKRQVGIAFIGFPILAMIFTSSL